MTTYYWKTTREKGQYVIRMNGYKVGQAKTKRRAEQMKKAMQADITHKAKTGKWKYRRMP